MRALDHVGLAVSDYARGKAFYSQALAPLGLSLLLEFSEAAAGFGRDDGTRPSFFIEAHGEPVRGRLHIAFGAGTRAQVDAFHTAAISAGGTDNGAPGVRWYHADYEPDADGALAHSRLAHAEINALLRLDSDHDWSDDTLYTALERRRVVLPRASPGADPTRGTASGATEWRVAAG